MTTHSKGVLHRDLKPGQVLICERSSCTGVRGGSTSNGRQVGNLRVLDCGLARLTGAGSTISTRLTEPGLVVGTLAYMSSEQARSEEVDPRGDAYSLGVMLYELMTGKRPLNLEGCWVGEVFSRINTEEPVRPRKAAPDLDPDLETIIQKAMQKAPSARHQSVADLAEERKSSRPAPRERMTCALPWPGPRGPPRPAAPWSPPEQTFRRTASHGLPSRVREQTHRPTCPQRPMQRPENVCVQDNATDRAIHHPPTPILRPNHLSPYSGPGSETPFGGPIRRRIAAR